MYSWVDLGGKGGGGGGYWHFRHNVPPLLKLGVVLRKSTWVVPPKKGLFGKALFLTTSHFLFLGTINV